MKRLAILLSGRGSNFHAIEGNCRTGALDAGIGLVISNRADAAGLGHARSLGLPSVCLPSKGLDRDLYDQQLAAEIRQANVDLICLAGFMRILSAGFVREFSGKVLNIHPSLLPAFPGLDAQKQALDYGAKITGCTVHFVDEGLDSGPVILQAAVPVLDGDTVEALSARILTEEHRLYSDAIRVVLSGRYRVEGRRVILSSAS